MPRTSPLCCPQLGGPYPEGNRIYELPERSDCRCQRSQRRYRWSHRRRLCPAGSYSVPTRPRRNQARGVRRNSPCILPARRSPPLRSNPRQPNRNASLLYPAAVRSRRYSRSLRRSHRPRKTGRCSGVRARSPLSSKRTRPDDADQKLLPLLKKPRGQIVFINSSAGLTARPNVGYFSATQHALKALTDTLRDEVNVDGIRVLSIYPGRTATPRIQALHVIEGRPYQPEYLLQPDDIASVVLNAVTLPWTAEVTDISLRPMQKSY